MKWIDGLFVTWVCVVLGRRRRRKREKEEDKEDKDEEDGFCFGLWVERKKNGSH